MGARAHLRQPTASYRLGTEQGPRRPAVGGKTSTNAVQVYNTEKAIHIPPLQEATDSSA